MRRSYEKKILLSYSIKSKHEVDNFLVDFQNFEWKIRPNIIVERLSQSISDYDIVILFLDKPNIIELEKLIRENKVIIPVLIENIAESSCDFIDFNDFKMAKVYDARKDLRFIYCAIKSQINSLYQDESFELNGNLRIEYLSKQRYNFALNAPFQVVKNKSLLLFRSLEKSSIFKIVNMKSGETICTINERDGLSFCWIDHLEYFVIYEIISELYSNWSQVYDLHGKHVKKLSEMSRAKSIAYNFINSKTYVLFSIADNLYGLYYCCVEIYNENLNFESRHAMRNIDNRNCIKCLNDGNVYIWLQLSNEVDVFSLEMNNLMKLRTIAIIDSIHSHPIYSNFILISSLDSLQLINTNSFITFGFFELPGVIKMIIDDDIIIVDDDDNIYCGKIRETQKTYLDPLYVCKLNPFSTHLYVNPYLLPCGNSACYNCICENFNIVKNTLKCNFDTCSQEHRYSSIIKNSTLIGKMQNNFLNITQNLVLKISRELNNLGE